MEICKELLIVFSVLMCFANLVCSARWSHSTYLSPDYRLLWSLGPGPQDITFEVQVKTLGYVGFGFSKDGRMAGSDMVVGWVDQGQVYFQVLATLRFYASGSYQEITGSNSFVAISQSSISRAINEVTNALNQPEILNSVIRFPQNIEGLQSIRTRFYETYQFPGIIGCIDCTHVSIVAPPANDEHVPEHIYVNRKNYHSLNVQLDRHVKDSPGSAMDREPEVDPSQDYQLLLGYENSTHTVLRFRRRLDTCDHHDIPITNDTMRIIWAFHRDEPVGGAVGPKSLPRHELGNSGAQSLYLVQRADQDAPGPEETARVWELRNPAVEPPSIPGDTLYWCRIFKIPPSITRKHHLIRYEPLQSISGTSGLQHVVLYECQDNPLVEKLADAPGRPCHESHSQPFMCNTVVASWAKGSEGFSFPPEAGYPLDSSNKYYLMETHYTVPMDGNVGSIDGSGLRLYYTPELRRYDAGVISMGMDPNWRHIIPPGQNRVVSSGHCVADCTRQAFPHAGINMFAVVMKTHKIGKQVALKHLRGSMELPPIANDDNVDADYQEYRRLQVPVRILPGDHLITECTYNSSGRSAITLGGLTSREETCLVMGLYYPRQKFLAACHSLPSLPTVLHSLGIQELSIGSNPVRIAAPPELSGMTLESRLVSYDWDNQFQSFQEATMRGSFKPICWTSQLTLLPGTDKESHYPNISKPYVRSTIDQCNYRRYSTEGWPGGTPVIELDGNHIEGVTKSKVSRSSIPAHEESLGLSRFFNSANQSMCNFLLLMVSVILVWFNR